MQSVTIAKQKDKLPKSAGKEYGLAFFHAPEINPILTKKSSCKQAFAAILAIWLGLQPFAAEASGFNNGTYTRYYNWVTDKNSSVNITASRMDTEDNGFATGLSTCLLKDGTQTVTANIPFSTFKITGLGNGTAVQDAAAIGQVQNGLLGWVIGGGTSDAITASYTPAITSLSDGMELDFRATAANTTTTPTFAPSGLTAHTITKNGGAALGIGDINGNLSEYKLRYNLANTRWELINPAVPTLTANHLFGMNATGGAASIALSGFTLGSGATLTASPVVLQTTATNPSSTVSSTGVMMGLAGAITPVSTGDLRITVTGNIRNDSGGDGANVQIRYGTGSAPSNGDALTGTAKGSSIGVVNVAAPGSFSSPFSETAIVTGLTGGTAYWIDVSLTAVTGGTASISNVSIAAEEIK